MNSSANLSEHGPASAVVLPADAPDAVEGTLDHEYNARLWAPGYAQTLAGFRERGTAIRRHPNVHLDLRWGPRERQLVDLFLPPNPSGPLLVFLHGGYWQYRTSGKDGVSFLAPAFLERGCAFAAIQYALCPDVDMDQMVEQVKEALIWVWRNLPSYGYHQTTSVVAGHSAGGHLAMTLAATDWDRHGFTSQPIRAAFGLSGLYDLAPLMSTYLNRDLRITLPVAQRNSPICHVKPGMPEVLLGVGALESPSFRNQTYDYANALRMAGVPVCAWTIEGKGHFNVLDCLTDPVEPMTQALLDTCIDTRGASI